MVVQKETSMAPCEQVTCCGRKREHNNEIELPKRRITTDFEETGYKYLCLRMLGNVLYNKYNLNLYRTIRHRMLRNNNS